MFRFTDTKLRLPAKRAADERRDDWEEIYADFAREQAAIQAGRCSQCGVPFCQIHCPLQNNIPDWLRLTAENRLQEAYELSQSTNNMPEICGRICPQDRLCEGSCVIEQSGHGTVTIGAVERYLTEKAWENGWVRALHPVEEKAEKVAIIGAGPAGLSAAENLRAIGYRVTVFDRYPEPGGLLLYGIPNFKLEKEVVYRRTDRLRDAGIEFVMRCNVGQDVTFQTLQRDYDAILLANGVYQSRPLSVPGSTSENVVEALPYLIACADTARREPLSLDSQCDVTNKSVIVVGGGDTAMDCVRSAIRQGAREVNCIYRRDRQNMPGSMREVTHAQEEGVTFTWCESPLTILKTEKTQDRASYIFETAKVSLADRDHTGRAIPKLLLEEKKAHEADVIILALGFEAEDLKENLALPKLAVTKKGTVRVPVSSLMTSIPGIFAAGDIVRGASLVVWAIRDGREAASEIAKYLRAKNRHKTSSLSYA